MPRTEGDEEQEGPGHTASGVQAGPAKVGSLLAVLLTVNMSTSPVTWPCSPSVCAHGEGHMPAHSQQLYLKYPKAGNNPTVHR